MNERQKRLLDEIENGTTVFNAKENTKEAYEAFKAVVSDLEELAAEGLITIDNLHQESHSGGRYIDHVRVRLVT